MAPLLAPANATGCPLTRIGRSSWTAYTETPASGSVPLSASQTTFSGTPATHGTKPHRQRKPLTSTSGAPPPASVVIGVSGQVPSTWGGLLAGTSVSAGACEDDAPIAAGVSVVGCRVRSAVPMSALTTSTTRPIDPRKPEGERPAVD